MPSYRGRFAPSPTGDLHLGSAAAALVAWLCARKEGGAFVIRVEDIDTPRVVPGIEERQLDDLRWLGLDWDEGPDTGGPVAPYRQSERTALYECALAELAAQGVLYWCDCSRAELMRTASAPHAGDEGPRYPGHCRARIVESPSGDFTATHWKRPPAIRLRVPDRTIAVTDAWQGESIENVEQVVGDFVLRRGDRVYAYQLAVVADDLGMRITEVVRGVDLLASAPRQALLAELLGGSAPRFAHLPLLVGPDGARLAKRERGVSLRDHRAIGRPPEEVVGALAAALGLVDTGRDEPIAVTPRELLADFDPRRLIGRRTVRIAP